MNLRERIDRLPENWASLVDLREELSINLSPVELYQVALSIVLRRPCNFLVFGAGNDSGIWQRLNKDGTTIFIEDANEWATKARQKNPGINVIEVDYGTSLSQWMYYFNNRSLLDLKLPAYVMERSWDVILVDGPFGGHNGPGRMKSIYASHKLRNPQTDVFVDDCDRKVEKFYASSLLGGTNVRWSNKKLQLFRIDGCSGKLMEMRSSAHEKIYCQPESDRKISKIGLFVWIGIVGDEIEWHFGPYRSSHYSVVTKDNKVLFSGLKSCGTYSGKLPPLEFCVRYDSPSGWSTCSEVLVWKNHSNEVLQWSG